MAGHDTICLGMMHDDSPAGLQVAYFQKDFPLMDRKGLGTLGTSAELGFKFSELGVIYG